MWSHLEYGDKKKQPFEDWQIIAMVIVALSVMAAPFIG